MNPANNINPTVPTPTALSRDDFTLVGTARPHGNGLAAGDGAADDLLSESDRITLQHLLDAVKAARVDASSKDPKVARAANWRIIGLISYLVGLFDGRHIPTPAVAPGFERLRGSDRPDVAGALDDLEAAITAGLASETRSVGGSILRGLGDVAIAIGAGLVVESIVV